mmetsp:Transcript_10786/g.21644  ORF Transcript_10786/g.21644 Transcript_10786/m.21644 type:complete len:203 (-) Transcript_10786:969-1577(-)
MDSDFRLLVPCFKVLKRHLLNGAEAIVVHWHELTHHLIDLLRCGLVQKKFLQKGPNLTAINKPAAVRVNFPESLPDIALDLVNRYQPKNLIHRSVPHHHVEDCEPYMCPVLMMVFASEVCAIERGFSPVLPILNIPRCHLLRGEPSSESILQLNVPLHHADVTKVEKQHDESLPPLDSSSSGGSCGAVVVDQGQSTKSNRVV